MSAKRTPRVELICVGSELLSGQVNTHQGYLSKKLRAVGLPLARESSLPDDVGEISDAVRRALQRCDALLLCGGLGPTFDDLTREAVCEATGRKLVFRPELWKGIQRKLARYKWSIPAQNRRQAFLIEGARALRNEHGSAPGQLLELPRAGRPAQLVALMPGPYAEMSPMFEAEVLPALKARYGRGLHPAALTVRLSGLPESEAEKRLAPVLALAGPEMSFTILAGSGRVDFHCWALAATAAKARRLVAEARRRAYRAVGDHIYGEDGATPESALGELLRRRRLTLALAESCTGGMLGASLTSVPGSSSYFKGGAVVYSDSLKASALGVRPETLKRHGAVSAECAAEMAAGARRLAGAEVGLSVTGIAGPAGGTKAKPVGLVHLAVDGPGRRSAHWELRLAGGRQTIRERACGSALHLLRRHLEGKP